MVEHTKEPWDIDEGGDAHKDGVVVLRRENHPDYEQTFIDMERAVACVNALAGIPDPAAYVAAFEGMRRTLERLQYWFDTDPEIIEALTAAEQADNARQLANIRAALLAARAAKGEAE